ncbi:MAG: DUF4912 domain-containing protein [Verrucomicrobiales bacterium]|nr:DUF4912 domain-containing protein [Verrucomicrobiales bacterium]
MHGEAFATEAQLGRLEPEGTHELMLVPRDPRSLYAHWDLSSRQRLDYAARSADSCLELRVYDGSVAGKLVATAKHAPTVFHCFIAVPSGGKKYQAELGYTDKSGHWHRISVSGVVLTPPEEMAAPAGPATPVAPATLQPTESIQRTKIDLRTLEATEIAAEPQPPKHAVHQVAESLRREQAQVSEAQPLQFRLVETPPKSESISTSPEGVESVPIPLGISSEMLGEAAPPPAWFNVNVEMVVYGSAEPGAKVTLGGVPVSMRPDGTFSCRVALPDGEHELVAECISAAGHEKRRVHLRLTRATVYNKIAV